MGWGDEKVLRSWMHHWDVSCLSIYGIILTVLLLFCFEKIKLYLILILRAVFVADII